MRSKPRIRMENRSSCEKGASCADQDTRTHLPHLDHRQPALGSLPAPPNSLPAPHRRAGTPCMSAYAGLLVSRPPEPPRFSQVSGWTDGRSPDPVEAVLARTEPRDHRRFLKSHLPADGLPIHDEVK